MTVPMWGRVAIDLKGMSIPDTLPILSDHENHRRGVIGHGKPTVSATNIRVSGSVSGSNQAAREIVQAGKNGFPWQASVGVRPLQFRRIRADETITINKQTLTGEFTLIETPELYEVSICAVGCDSATMVKIAASMKGTTNMTTENKPTAEAVEAAETARIDAVKKICAGKFPNIEAQAINEGWDSDQTELNVLRASRPRNVASYHETFTGNPVELIQCAVLNRAGHSKVAEKHFKPETLEAARRVPHLHMMDLARYALRADGVDADSFATKEALVKAAFSTISLPNALADSMNKVLLDSYQLTPATWRSFANIRPVSNFHDATALRPGFVGSIERLAPDGEIKHGTVSEGTITFSVATYARMLAITRQMIINDDTSFLGTMPQEMAKAASRTLSDTVYETLLANADSHFDAGNSNLLTGGDSALSITSLASAIEAMRKQLDSDNNDLDIVPSVLLVPPELEGTARAILESMEVNATEGSPTGNSLKGAAALQVEPRLSNTTKFTNASTTAWYLFGSPQSVPMVVAFLNGVETPTVEQADTDFNTLGLQMRVFHDFGAALGDHRSCVKSDGV